jgi:hypothetical protein
MSRAHLLATIPSKRPDRAAARSIAVLIEVPLVSGKPATRARVDALVRRAGTRRTRRRLRREVRVAVAALLVLAPLVSASTLAWSGRPDRALTCSIAEARAEAEAGEAGLAAGQISSRENRSHGTVVLPVALTPDSGGAPPVVFPGYVLPDDTLEGRAHEGG